MTNTLEPQRDGTCPECGRFAEISCSVHGHLEGDPWAEVERLRRALDESDNLVVHERGRTAAAQAEVERLRARIVKWQRSTIDLAHEHRKAQAEAERLREDRDESDRQWRFERDRARKAEAEVERLRTLQRRSDANAAMLRREVERLREERGRCAVDLRAANRRIDALEAEVERLLTDREDARAEVERLREENAAMFERCDKQDAWRLEGERLRDACSEAYRQLSRYDDKGPKQIGRAMLTLERAIPELGTRKDDDHG